MGDAEQLRIRGFPQGRYVRIRFKALPAEFVTNFRWVRFALPWPFRFCVGGNRCLNGVVVMPVFLPSLFCRHL